MSVQTPAILIIDDDPAVRGSLAAYLEDRDYRVLTAGDGRDGLQRLERDSPDLVLVDLTMPELDGFEVLRRAGQSHPDLPLIVVSGAGRVADTVRALRLGAADYIIKPIEDMATVTHAIDRALERARLREENRRYQSHLEDLVRERTASLKKANTDLDVLNQRLRRLVDTAKGLSACSHVKEFGRCLLEEFARTMVATGGSLYWAERDGLRLAHALDPGHAPEFLPLPLPAESILRRAMEQNAPILIPDLRDDRSLVSSGWQGYSDGSALVFPIQDEGGGVAGVLTLHNKLPPPFVEQDKEIGVILASYSCETLRAIRSFDALRESERRFRELADLLPQAVCEMDLSGRILYANRDAFRMFGYAPEDLQRGITVFDVIISQEHARVRDNMTRIAQGEPDTGKEYVAVKKSGETFPVLSYTSPMTGNGQVVGLRGVVVDITERKRAEQERERLMSAIEQAAEVVVITNTEGTIVYVNPAFERVTGYSRAEAVGQNPRILKSGRHDQSFYHDLWATITGGGTWSGRIVNKRKDGRLYTDETSVAPVRDGSGRITHFVSVKRDITRELELQSQLRQAQKMEAIGALAGGIAHDFNNILSVILGFCELALEDVGDDQPLRQKLSQIALAGNRAKDLVAQILTFSRQTEKEVRPILIQPIVKEAFKLLRAAIPSTITIRTSFSAGDETVVADATQIYQIVMNFCTNALHAMRDKGGVLEVRVEAGQMPAEALENSTEGSGGRAVVLTVRDTGHGMDAQTMERIFDPYFTTKKKGEGTGLGLAVVHSIVESHGGVIRVESAPGQGATFRVYLPACASPGATVPVAAPAAALMGSERILFVDDEAAISDMARSGLERLGYAVTAFTRPFDALEAFFQSPGAFDAVITDLTMPGMTGLDLAAEICRERPELPVVLCTGFHRSVDAQTAQAAGIRDVVQKPCTAEQLAAALRKLLGAAPAPAPPAARMDGARPPAPAAVEAILATLPPDLAEALRVNVEMLHATGIRELLPFVARHNTSLAQRLQALVDAYDWDRLRTLLKERSPA